MSTKRFAVLLAGGSGSRMGSSMNKVLLPVAGVPCIIRSANALAPFADHLVLVCRPQDETALRELFSECAPEVPLTFCPGGNIRQESVFQGLKTIEALSESHDDPIVLIHDGARCLVPAEVIQSCVTSVETYGSGVAAIPVTDTLRQADDSGVSGETVPREKLYTMQTPQAFRLRPLLAAFHLAREDGFEGTDDASVMAHAGFPVHLSAGSRLNIKLTTKEDLIMAESILSSSLPPFRVGQGYDVHQLCEGRKLILCGVEIPHSLGLLGHSDADVALHALMDALLGAAGLGDIGRHFPDTDDQYKGIDSMKLLAAVMEKLQEAGFSPVNADLTIVAQKPKLAPYIPRMAENVAFALRIPLSCVNVKATTTERLGFEGRMEGISAQAICLLQKSR